MKIIITFVPFRIRIVRQVLYNSIKNIPINNEFKIGKNVDGKRIKTSQSDVSVEFRSYNYGSTGYNVHDFKKIVMVVEGVAECETCDIFGNTTIIKLKKNDVCVVHPFVINRVNGLTRYCKVYVTASDE